MSNVICIGTRKRCLRYQKAGHGVATITQYISAVKIPINPRNHASRIRGQPF